MSEKYNIQKLNIDLNNGETTTFNPFDTDNVTKMMTNKEIKAIIHDFYKSNHSLLDELSPDESTADEGDRWVVFQLERNLAYKSQFESFTEAENTLLQLLLTSSEDNHLKYSNHLVNEFKNVLKEMEE